jgi:hypothetical protein
MPWNDKSASGDSTWESIIVNAFGNSDAEDAVLGSEVQQAGYMGVKGALAEVRQGLCAEVWNAELFPDDVVR